MIHQPNRIESVPRRRVENSMRTLSFHSLIALCLLSLLGGCSPQTKAVRIASPVSPLVELITRRLDLARQVAWIKYQNNLPIYDAAREKELLASLVEQGVREGLPAKEVETFFAAQIRASRQVQADLIHKWKRGGLLPAFPPQDLRRDIRPKLDAVSAQMLRELVRLRTLSARPGLAAETRRVILSQGYSWQVARFAASPL